MLQALLVAVAYNAALAPQPFPSVVSVASDATPSELYVVVRGLAPLKIYIIIADLHEITISETISLALPPHVINLLKNICVLVAKMVFFFLIKKLECTCIPTLSLTSYGIDPVMITLMTLLCSASGQP